ncbi:MAG: hypothetical protein M3P49_06695 [Actinomycetota bacterium]|nr:hypothetical protein [Actinomycetota bacterium]
MAKAAIMASRSMDAYESVMEMIEEHGNPQYTEALRNITPAMASSRNAEHRDAFVAIILEAQAEMIEGLRYETAVLKERLDNLENPPATASVGKAKK